MVYSNNFNQIRVGVRNSVVTQVVNAVDADATAFITAAGITDLTQAAAISTLVNDLKAYGIWSKMKALYPFVGGSATSHKFNLKDPRDLDAAYRLVFNGGWTHGSTGAKPNGTTGYADTKLIPSSALTNNSSHLSTYLRTDTNGLLCDIGIDGFTGCLSIWSRYNNLFYAQINNVLGNFLTSSNSNSLGLHISNRTASNILNTWKNGTLIGSGTNSSSTKSAKTIFIAALNDLSSVALFFSPREQAFASIGDGLTSTEAANFYTAVQKFQTTLGRQVGTPAVSDSDAQAFLNAAGITDLTQTSAINTLVVDLKAAGVWTKMKAVYPFIGGNATSHKFNLKDPRDLDVSYRLQFNGGWTHTSTGALPNGTTGYADTFLIPSTTLTNYSSHLSLYSRTTRVGANKIQGAYQGSPTFNQFAIQIRSTSNTTVSIQYDGATGNDYASFTDTNSIGFYIANRSAINLNKINLNGVVRNTNTISSTKSLPNTRFLLGALSTGVSTVGYYDDLQLAFSSIGDGLTDAESTAFYTAVQKFQTTLGRQTDVPLVSDSDAQAFLTAAGITSYTQANAVNTLVTDLKSAGVWTKMKAIYPFVGGTSTSHKWNLKDPRDLDVAYRLVFNGGMSHDSRGIVPNGTTGYANTFIDPYILAINSGFGFYSLTNNSTNSADIGAISYNMSNPPTYSPTRLFQIANSGTTKYVSISSDVSISYSDTDTRGFYQGWRSDSSTIKSMKGTSLLSTSAPYLSTTAYSNGMRYYIGGRYEGGIMQTPSSRVLSFSFFQENFNDTDAQNLYTAVQKFQTTLGRQIGTPIYNNSLVLNLDAGNANSYPGTGTTWFDLASGNNGTLVNGPTYDTTNGGSIVFDGVNDYVGLGNTPIFGTSSFTIDMWIYLPTTDSSYRAILSKRSNSNYTGFAVYRAPYSNSVAIQLAYSHSGPYFTTSILSTSNSWNHISIIVDRTSKTVVLYSNGIKNTSTLDITNLGDMTNNGVNLNIGLETGIPNWNSKISTTKIYSRVLSEAEVLNNFNSTRGRFGL